MNKNEVMNKISRSVNKVGFQLKKHSPEILIVAGVAGTIVSAVMACKATTKIGKVLDETKEELDSVHEAIENQQIDDGKKEIATVYASAGVKMAKLYGPSVILGTLSIGSILASNDILRKRNVALAAAYATVDKSFKEYRSRVVNRFGENVDRELKYNIKTEEVEEIVVDEKGKEKKVKKTVEVSGMNEESEFARYFDNRSPYWDESPDACLMFLRSEEHYANDLLRLKGFLTLNEVYGRLGIPETKAGMVVGWTYDKDNPDGDNYVDFGLFQTTRQNVHDFVNGYTNTVLLDFNVDGNIYTKM